MCGIAGGTSLDVRSLGWMMAALEHRGPDDSGLFAENGVALGARRLSIIDVPGGHQPIRNEDGTVTVVFNGEIYNYRALREHLLRRSHRLATQSDTEVLVHLYEDYGVELVHALEGMFAFALWDSKQRLLVLARDRFGEKPLFYAERDGELAFASELHALVAGGACGWELEPEALDEYFTFGYVAAPGSVVRGVRQLPAGHVLTWKPSASANVRPYWSPQQLASSPGGSIVEALEAADALLDDSVRSRLVADVPVGVFLSGGVDSTLLAVLAARHAHELKTFTVTYDRGSVSEGAQARAAARLVGAEHHELVLTGDRVRERVPGYLAALDQPIADEAFVALRAVSEFARSEVKVAVGGEGADEVFGGYPRYRWLARSAAIERVTPASVRRGAGRFAAALPGSAHRLQRVLEPGPLAERHVDWVTDGRQALRATLYGPRLLDHIHRRTRKGRPAPSVNGSVEGLLMRLDQEHWLPGDVLAKADRASMQASLELRTPYLQRELVELAATVPPKAHVSGGGKLILRRALARAHPEAAHRRAKTAFRTPAAEWLRGPLASALVQQLEASRLYADGWFDRDAVRDVVREHQQGVDRTAVLWPVFVLGAWLDAR